MSMSEIIWDDGTPFTIGEAARMMRDMRRDKSYRAYPVGVAVGRYIRWMRNEWGATERSLEDYESILSRLAMQHIDLELSDFNPPVGTERIREFVDDTWEDRSSSTRGKVISVLKSFFRWAYENDLVIGDPTVKIRRPKKRTVKRHAHDPLEVKRIIQAQPALRDQVAISLMARLGLRKNELRTLRWKDVDLVHGEIRVLGKGEKHATIPIVYKDLSLELGMLRTETNPGDEDYLLYPQRIGNLPGQTKPIREYRDKPMEPSTMHRWWQRCLKRADVTHFPMHELRHTAGTEFMRATGNLKLTQKFMRHVSFTTTADVYMHLDTDDLIQGMKLADLRWTGGGQE